MSVLNCFLIKMGWIRTTMRLAVVGGAGYAACKADVWGDNKTTVNYISKQCDSCDKSVFTLR